MSETPLSLAVVLFERFVRFRTANITALDTVPEDACDIIPAGLRNNIHWQAGHLATVQASLLYRRCGVDAPLDDSWFASFAKGTSPSDWSGSTPSYADARTQLRALVDRTRSDLPSLAGLAYPEPVTVTGGERLSTFLDALGFLTIHEALHLGTINTMRRLAAVR
ncbi:MAG: DinB family protein [candidate division Zixibacteria bacterium]|jgi:hypothetical protein|nr:DinB family protein [candidate division Zixibacteria bacterium]